LVGAKVIGSFIRENDNDFRSNLSLGGKAIPYSITPEYKKIAEKTAKLLKLDYCSVDFFVNENEPMICEVNPDPALQS
jgi:ribosomal protein S6--L-glutamate ligase/gamma-F420-2:alpha-L-glutamate ligase